VLFFFPLYLQSAMVKSGVSYNKATEKIVWRLGTINQENEKGNVEIVVAEVL
jgi:hypothetical protein